MVYYNTNCIFLFREDSQLKGNKVQLRENWQNGGSIKDIIVCFADIMLVLAVLLGLTSCNNSEPVLMDNVNT
jgi:hypothetical protein